MAAAGPVMALAHAALRITDDLQGQAESPTARSRAFQLVTEETRATSDVAGAYLFLSY